MRLRVAATAFARARGLLGRRPEWLGKDGVLLLAPCDNIHTFGMRCPIDVAFVDARGVVVASREALAPGRICGFRGAVAALERPSPGVETACGLAGSERWFRVGDVIGMEIVNKMK